MPRVINWDLHVIKQSKRIRGYSMPHESNLECQESSLTPPKCCKTTKDRKTHSFKSRVLTEMSLGWLLHSCIYCDVYVIEVRKFSCYVNELLQKHPRDISCQFWLPKYKSRPQTSMMVMSQGFTLPQVPKLLRPIGRNVECAKQLCIPCSWRYRATWMNCIHVPKWRWTK